MKLLQPEKHIGVAIGYKILDLHVISNLFTGPLLSMKQDVFCQDCLNDFMALGRPAWIEARLMIQNLLAPTNHVLQDEPLKSK